MRADIAERVHTEDAHMKKKAALVLSVTPMKEERQFRKVIFFNG
jgi:hypothetical protein